jgi:hypothetical protein
LPADEEHDYGGYRIQHFQHQTIWWNKTTGGCAAGITYTTEEVEDWEPSREPMLT